MTVSPEKYWRKGSSRRISNSTGLRGLEAKGAVMQETRLLEMFEVRGLTGLATVGDPVILCQPADQARDVYFIQSLHQIRSTDGVTGKQNRVAAEYVSISRQIQLTDTRVRKFGIGEASIRTPVCRGHQTRSKGLETRPSP